MALRKLDEIKKAVNDLSPDEQRQLAEYLAERTKLEKYPGKVVDLTPFYGTAHFEEDAMEMQKRWRAEWD